MWESYRPVNRRADVDQYLVCSLNVLRMVDVDEDLVICPIPNCSIEFSYTLALTMATYAGIAQSRNCAIGKVRI